MICLNDDLQYLFFVLAILKEDKPSVSNMTEGRDKNLPSFWIPSMTPEAKPQILQKPVS